MRRLENTTEAVQWLRARVTGTLQTDSRLVAPGDGFIAWPGAATDGRAHVASAMARGATACLVEQSGAEPFGLHGPHGGVDRPQGCHWRHRCAVVCWAFPGAG